MPFHVHAYVDDHVLNAAAATAKDAFAKAIEWHVVGKLTDVSISDGIRSYSIAEFASVMALAEIANTKALAEQNAAGKTGLRTAPLSAQASNGRPGPKRLSKGLVETPEVSDPVSNLSRSGVKARPRLHDGA